MRTLARSFLDPIPQETKDRLKSLSIDFIKTHTKPIRLIFFGSIVNKNFDACSDIDIVAIYDSIQSADQARRVLYTKPLPNLGHSLEILCVDEETFTHKAAIGGVYAVAREEGAEFRFINA